MNNKVNPATDYKLCFGKFPGCIVAANSKKYEHGDYQMLAHIDHDGRRINYLKKDLPPAVIGEIEAFARGLHTADYSITLTPEIVADALRETYRTDAAMAILTEAQRRGLVFVHSWTQAEWTTEGYRKAYIDKTELI